MTLHFLVPTGYSEQPSGGNVYDGRVLAGLVGLGWDVVSHEVGSEGPLPEPAAGALVLVDGLVLARSAEELARSEAVLVPLVHMPFETAGERDLLAVAPVVVVTSGWTKRWLVEHYGLDADRVHVAVPGVDMADPVSGTAAGGELVCVATVQPAKGHDVLLAALATLTDLDWRCALVGSLDADPDFVDDLHKAAADSGIADRLAFSGALPHDDVRAAYAGADVLVLPSRAETYGMVVTEALARGVPVLVSDAGGLPETLGRDPGGRVPGMVVQAGRVAPLGAALHGWLIDPARRAELRRYAQWRRELLQGWEVTSRCVATVLTRAGGTPA